MRKSAWQKRGCTLQMREQCRERLEHKREPGQFQVLCSLGVCEPKYMSELGKTSESLASE